MGPWGYVGSQVSELTSLLVRIKAFMLFLFCGADIRDRMVFKFNERNGARIWDVVYCCVGSER